MLYFTLLIILVTCRVWFGASLNSRTAAAIVPVCACMCCVIDSVASHSCCRVLICHSLESLSSGESVASLSLV